MARSLVDAPIEVLVEQARYTLAGLPEVSTLGPALGALGVDLAVVEARLACAADVADQRLAAFRAAKRHDEDVRQRQQELAARAGAWSSDLRARARLITNDPHAAGVLRGVCSGLRRETRRFASAWEDLARAVPTLRRHAAAVEAALGPEAVAWPESLLAEADALVAESAQAARSLADARAQLVAPRAELVAALQHLRDAWTEAARRSSYASPVPPPSFSVFAAWRSHARRTSPTAE